MQRNPGPERFILALALVLPLGLIVVVLLQLPGVSLGLPSSVVYADTNEQVIASHLAPSNPAPPPTLSPPTATPKPTATPVASPTTAPAPDAQASPTPQTGRIYTVKSGDQLKNIAATYHMGIGQIIGVNNIPNPDSLKVGQVLTIPDS
ncbi:MAG TPA: LysM domain-containing protein [Chloroflexota bacterium]